jgi:hypothetical protein
MLYKVNSLTLGTSVLKKIFEINIQFNISQICHIEKFGFLLLFKDHHFIGHSDYKGKLTIPWFGKINESGDNYGTSPSFNYPSSICYSKRLNTCFIIENGGTKIKSIELGSKYCNKIQLSNNIDEMFSKIKSKENTITSCDIDKNGCLYWVANDVNRCFKKKHEDNMATSYIGNGKSGFSTSNNLNHCSLSRPCGIICLNDKLYITEYGNNCIREIGSHASTILGDPLNNILSHPTQIKNIGNILLFIDDEGIKYVSLVDKNNGLLYKSNNIISIDIINESKKELYLLEKV